MDEAFCVWAFKLSTKSFKPYAQVYMYTMNKHIGVFTVRPDSFTQ